jgi:tetratricopeptide (TPR) repeat protein
MMEMRGRDEEAIDQLSSALQYDPNLVDARFSLADALRRVGRPEASLEHYSALVRADPSASQARFGYAMALVRLRRFQEARASLEEGVKAHPDQPGFAHALARVLAAAPDDGVRDGHRALSIVQELRKNYSGVALTETLAMAQAEVGQYDQAATSQRSTVAEARRAKQEALAARLAENLMLYERGMPCRIPWRDDDPVLVPRAAPPTSWAGRR